MKTETVTVRLLNQDGSMTAPILVPKIERSEAEWELRLSPEQYRIARAQGTERAFCGLFSETHKPGIYACVGCGLPLFGAGAKFESGTGWPSFFQPLADENISSEIDTSIGATREEIHCARCETHLGHVFPDGPPPTNLRYCINSASLMFVEDGVPLVETAIFGAGCFWGVEEEFRKLEGVVATAAGYSGGTTPNPTYQEVCAHTTGHAETVKVEFDPKLCPYQKLLNCFFEIHDPTTRNRQGFDVGDNYRSAIFFTLPMQETLARETISRLTSQKAFRKPIVTVVDLAGPFYPAEDYHQKYLARRGETSCSLH